MKNYRDLKPEVLEMFGLSRITPNNVIADVIRNQQQPVEDEPENLESIESPSSQVPYQLCHKAIAFKCMSRRPKYVVGVDFDGTCVLYDYPNVGRDNRYAVEVLKQIVAHGAGIILYTMRTGKELSDAVSWFGEREIHLYGINQNPTQAEWSSSRKVYCHLYIDDAALGCPLIYDPEVSKRPFVDWVEVDKLLQKHSWYMEPIIHK